MNEAVLNKKRNQARLHWVNRASAFLREIKLPHQQIPSYISDPENCFFKGCWIENSMLHYCPARVDPGELLHEAGHLALIPRDQWPLLEPGKTPPNPPLGMVSELGDAAVEAWDYAAAIHAEIPILAVFEKGFDGKGYKVMQQIENHNHPGFTLLRFLGLSQKWGTCSRWLIGKATIDSSTETAQKLLKTCTRHEIEVIIKNTQALIK